MICSKFLVNFMIDSTKITILLCLTILVTSILVMSYNEYVNRFSIIATQNNVIYIFDKKSAVLNKCENGQCTQIPTYFPQNPLLQWNNTQQQTQQYATNITHLPQQQHQMNNQNVNNNSNQVQNNTNNNNMNQNINNNNQQVNNVPQVTIVNSGKK